MIPKYDPDAAWDGRWETAKFNNRMQVTELGLGNSATDASVWKTNYEYGELQTNGTVDTTKNTGNIARQTLTVPGTSFVQSYKYDSLYRLTEAEETANGNQNWIQQFGYDRYGNRIAFDQAIGSLTLSTTPSVDANTNRFVISGTNFQYDLNGNLIRDEEGRQFTFNGDNKQTQVKDASNNTIGQYFYDGEGKRVKKVTNLETTVFVYSAGKLVAEYSTKLSQTPSVSYTTTDHLGSPRIITDALGQVSSRRDFLPFGEDIYQNVGARTSALNYGSSADEVRQQFTGYQKDTETGLDFAEARMYENRLGRFTAVDPLLASGKSANPQTFNRYVYVGNNPVFWVDPNGTDWVKVKHTRVTYGRTYVTYQPVWKDFAAGQAKWTQGIYRVQYGEDKGKWVALDPWNNRHAVVGSRREALAAYEGYRSEMKANALAGAVQPVVDTINAAEVLQSRGASLTTGQNGLGTQIRDSAFNAAGASVDENSGPFRSANSVSSTLGAVNSTVGGTGLLFRISSFSKMNTPGGLNLYKWGTPQSTVSSGWKTGDHFLYLPNQGSPKLNWKQNYGSLRRSMNSGEPIYDTYRNADGSLIPARTIDPNTGKQSGAFLNAERSTLMERGWSYNYYTGEWMRP